MRFIHVGNGHVIVASRVVGIINLQNISLPLIKYRKRQEETGVVIDVTGGKPTRSLILTDTPHIILSKIRKDSLMTRILRA
jgi:regulator of extracellular matrix RemA (YlzA/DUF370 family)